MMFQFVATQPAPSCNTIQHIALPQTAPQGAEPLFARYERTKDGGYRYETATYMNLLHRTRWQTLAEIGTISLEVTCVGCGRLVLQGASASDTKNQYSFLDLAYIDVKSNDPITLTTDLNDAYDFYSLAWETEKKHSLTILNACYTEKDGSSNKTEPPVRLAFVIPTYQRINDITQTINKYKEICNLSSYIEKSTHIFIVNNDTTIKNFPYSSEKNITIIHNNHNFGGSGGFARGAYEALTQKDFSHIVFMDDDVIIHEESLFRTLALLTRLKKSYANQIISGSMFTRENPTWCHVIMEGLNENGLGETIAGKQDLSSRQHVTDILTAVQQYTPLHIDAESTIKITPQKIIRPYAAWWYCVIPVAIFSQYGYPLPVFFRGDDQEFGMRIKSFPLPLNGICVWHADFSNKYSLLRLYLGVRNNAITNILHLKKWKRNLLRQICFKLAREIARCNYAECAIRILAWQDFLHFAFIPSYGEFLISRVASISKQFPQPEKATEEPQQAYPRRRGKKFFPLLLLYLTLGGGLLPDALRNRLYFFWNPENQQNCFHRFKAMHFTFFSLVLMGKILFLSRSNFIKAIPQYCFKKNSTSIEVYKYKHN